MLNLFSPYINILRRTKVIVNKYSKNAELIKKSCWIQELIIFYPSILKSDLESSYPNIQQNFKNKIMTFEKLKIEKYTFQIKL